MADNNNITVAPQGFVDIGSSSPAPISQSIPQAPAGFVDASQSEQPESVATTQPTLMSRVGKFAIDTMGNIGAGAIQSVEGISEAGHKAIHAALPEGVAEALSPNVGMQAERQYTQPLTAPQGSRASQIVGYGGENLMEFLMGDEALKGMSLSDKLLKSGKIAKIIESSPRLMQALQYGANIANLADKYPQIAELLSGSARAGAVQAAQTTAKTGGDVKAGAKEGAEVGAGGALLGAPFAAAGEILSKGAKTGETLNKMAQIGQNAPEKSEGVNAVRGWIADAEDAMHKNFENGIQDMKGDLKGEVISPEGSNVSKKAQELLKTVPGEGPKLSQELSSELQGIVPGTERTDPLLRKLAQPIQESETTMTPKEYLKAVGADSKSILKTPQDKEIVNSLIEAYKNGEEVPMSSIIKDAQGNILEADGRHRALAALQAGRATIPVKLTSKMSDFDIDGLIDLRQKLGAQVRQLPFGDPNARRLRQLQYAIDDDIQSMADNAGESQVSENYKNLRDNYKNQLADIESTPIQKLLTDEPGKVQNDVGNYLLSGGNSKSKIETLQRVIGPERMGTVADSIVKNWIADATNEAGLFDPTKFLKQWNKVDPEVRDRLFDLNNRNVDVSKFVQDANDARNVQTAIQAGLLTAAGGAIHGPLGAMIGLVLGTGDSAAAHLAGRGLLDYVVSHPTTWSLFNKTQKAVSKAAEAAPKAAKVANAVSVTPSVLHRVYAGARSSLSGQ